MSKTFRFNKTSLLALVKTGNTVAVRDSEEKGLKFKVGKLRSVFLFEKRISGRTNSSPITITIGAFPAITIEDARQEARRLSTLCEKGQDPRLVLDSRQEKPGLLVETAIDKFFSLKKDLRPITLVKYRNVVSLNFPVSWRKLELTAITPNMIVEQFHSIRKTARVRCWEFLKVFTNIWNTCKPFYKDRHRNPLLEKNPIPEAREMIKHIKRDPCKRSVIPKSSLGKFVVIVEQLMKGEVEFGPNSRQEGVSPMVIRMCNIALITLFTAMRFTETKCLRWDYVDLEQGFIRLPGMADNQESGFIGTKNAQDHWIPLSTYPRNLLEKLFDERGTLSPFVFPGIQDPTKPVERCREVFYRISQLIGSHYSPHTSRRTFASVANEVGLGFLDVKRMLNHAFEGGVTGGYVVPDFNPVRDQEKFQKVCDYILARRASFLGKERAEEVGFDHRRALNKLKHFALELGLDPEEALEMIVADKTAVA